MVGPSAPSAVVTFDLRSHLAGKPFGEWPTVPLPNLRGITWRRSDRTYFMVQNSPRALVQCDQAGNVIKTLDVNASLIGLDLDSTDNDLLWLADYYRGVLAVRISTGAIEVDRVITDLPYITAVCALPDTIWVGSGYNFQRKIAVYDRQDWTLLATIATPVGPRDMTWDGRYVWLAGDRDIVALDTETLEAVPGQVVSVQGASRLNGIAVADDSIVVTDGGRIYRVHMPSLTVRPERVRISKDKGAVAQRAQVSWPNGNPYDPRDLPGYYSPDRGIDRPETLNGWKDVVVPGADITIEMGYGEDRSLAFAGQVDEVSIDVEGGDSRADYSISIDCRDHGWRLLDQTVVNDQGEYYLAYEDPEGIEASLTARDLLIRAGFAPDKVFTEPTGIVVQCKVFERQSYADALEWLSNVTGYELLLYDDGSAYWRYPSDRQPAEWRQPLRLEGTDWVTLGHAPIVAGSMVLEDPTETDEGGTPVCYTEGVDYEVDLAAGAVRRLDGGSIPDGGQVLASYVYAAWTFREGEDLFRIGYKLTRRDQYARIRVAGEATDPDDPTQKFPVYGTWTHPAAAANGLPPAKVQFVEIRELDSAEKCQAAANQLGHDMLPHAREVRFAAVAVPWLQPGDCIQIVESSTTISEVYRISELEIEYGPDGAIMYGVAHHYGYAPPPATEEVTPDA